MTIFFSLLFFLCTSYAMEHDNSHCIKIAPNHPAFQSEIIQEMLKDEIDISDGIIVPTWITPTILHNMKTFKKPAKSYKHLVPYAAACEAGAALVVGYKLWKK